MKIILTLISVLMVIVSCQIQSSNELIEDKAALTNRIELSSNFDGDFDKTNSSSEETIRGLTYSMKSMTAFNFLQHKGENIEPTDIDNLKKEIVIFFEIESEDSKTQILDIPEMKYNKEDAIQYLMGEIVKDFQIQQGDSTIHPEGALYEGNISGINRLRIIFFMGNGLNIEDGYIAQYYDNLFGSGIIQLKN